MNRSFWAALWFALTLSCLTAAAAQPNLIPYQPLGWSDRIVVAKSLGATNDSSLLTAADTLYISWAVLNDSATPIASSFNITVYVDGNVMGTWIPDSLDANNYTYIQDFAIGFLTAGSHNVQIIADTGGVIAESNEVDNTYSKPITVSSIRADPPTITFSGGPPSLGGSGAIAKASLNLQPATPTPLPPVTTPGNKLIDPLQLEQDLATAPKIKVIVNLNPPLDVLARTDLSSSASRRALRQVMRRLQQDLLDVLPISHVKARYRFDNMASFSAEVTLDGLQALQSDPRVRSIEPVYTLEQHLAQGIPLIGGMTYRSSYNGAGLAIAVCDTGIDYRHVRLGGGSFPNSKVLGGYDFGDGDADPIPNSQPHGTACAGIAAGDPGTVGDYIGGVAYNAKLYALKISTANTGSATSDALVAAWDWCVTHQNDNPSYPIKVISTSFGGGRYFTTCDTEVPSMTTAANNAIAAGITICASTGNEGYCDSIGWPACISGIIAVGGVYDAAFGHYFPCVDAGSCANKSSTRSCTGFFCDDVTAADEVTSFSNAASFVGVLAPANQCYTLDIPGSAGYSSGDYTDSFGGTSAAAPYAAGAVACLQSAAQDLLGNFLSVSDVRSRLTLHGDNITDTKVAITKPRVNLAHSIESLTNTVQLLRIYNDGATVLTVNSITAQTPAFWLTIAPSGPFTVATGAYQDVTVTADLIHAPIGQSTNRLLVSSSDSANSPYPEGVTLIVNNLNHAPTLSNIDDQLTNTNTPTAAIAFTVNDAETTAGSLTVSGSSSDTSLVPNENIVFGGSGSARNVVITPSANLSGSCTITVAVSDGWKTASDTFVLTVDGIPTISPLSNQSTSANVATGAIGFTIGDFETAPGSLSVSGSSSNPTLVPNGNIVFGGTGASRTVTVTPAANASGTATISVMVSDGTATATNSFLLTVNAVVVGRYVFYNQSAFDGNSAAANASDDSAIATDKVALLPGGTASFTNYTSYSFGINGVIVDIAGLPTTPVASDFAFSVGNDSNPALWSAGPAPSTISVRNGAGSAGSSRVTIIWPNKMIQQKWLQIEILATANTGLAVPDYFLFGNAIADSGNSTTDAQVDVSDQNGARIHPRTFLNPAPINYPYDYNRDQRVDVSDQNLARINGTTFLNALKLINLTNYHPGGS